MEEASPINSTLVDLALWLIMLVIILGLGIPYLSEGQACKQHQVDVFALSEDITAFHDHRDVSLAPAQLILNSFYRALRDERVVGFEQVVSLGTDLTQPIAPLQVTHKLVQKKTPDQIKQGTQLVAVSKRSSAPPIISQQGKLNPDLEKISDKLAAENVTASLSAKHCDTESGKNSPSHSVRIREHLFDSIIRQAASRYQVDPYLVKAIIMAESSYNPKAVSKKGAKGLMQLMPKTAKALGVEDSFNPEHNINAGVKYFKQLLNQFSGDVKLALAAYNAGSKRVKKYKGIPPYKATQYYVKKVFEYHEHYRE